MGQAEAGATKRVVVATRNKHKLVEIAALLDGLGWQLVAIDALAPDAALREDEDTFEGNALAKARQAAAATGLPALADDSGLEVAALGGAPGVYSARYAGLPSDDERNNDKLLAALAGVPADRRAGAYRCVAAFVDPARGLELWRSGSCAGRLLEARQGHGGFGYDPLFFLPDLGKTMAELDLPTKNGLSHRAAAFRALAAALRELPAQR
jgi:XTP/dITP diphosphohydrolase